MAREDLTYFITHLRAMEERAEAAEARAAETESALKLATTLMRFEAEQRARAEAAVELAAAERDGWEARYYAERRDRLEAEAEAEDWRERYVMILRLNHGIMAKNAQYSKAARRVAEYFRAAQAAFRAEYDARIEWAAKLQAEYDAMKQRAEQLQDKVNHWFAEVSELKEDNERLRNECDTYAERLDAMKQSAERAEYELANKD